MSENEFLAHHGIKGQKWGVRRFQNYDGTLIKKAGKKEKKEYEYTSDTKKYKASDARHLTDEELRKRTKRLRDENDYRMAVKQNQEADLSPRQKMVKKIFVDSAANAASEVVKNVYSKAATAFITERFPSLMGQKDNSKDKNK